MNYNSFLLFFPPIVFGNELIKKLIEQYIFIYMYCTLLQYVTKNIFYQVRLLVDWDKLFRGVLNIGLQVKKENCKSFRPS